MTDHLSKRLKPHKIEDIKKFMKRKYRSPKITKGGGTQIHPTTVLGSWGFTWARKEDGGFLTAHNLGNIEIGKNVKIGEHCVIRRSTLPDTATQIGDGTVLISYVNVGHNCKIGRNSWIGPHVCLNGSVEIGNNCWIAGHAVIRQHVKIGDNAMVGLGAVVINDVPAGETVVGTPAVPIRFLGNFIDPSFKYGENLTIGKNNIIHEGVEVGDNVTIESGVELREGTIIGDECYIDSGVKSSGGCKIGNNVTLRFNAIIARNVVIEDDVFISPLVMFVNIAFTDKEKRKTIVRRGAKLGTGSIINDGVEIGEGVMIGANSFVNKNCLEKGIYVGTPAKRLEKRLIQKED